jgi:hypothetical protein
MVFGVKMGKEVAKFRRPLVKILAIESPIRISPEEGVPLFPGNAAAKAEGHPIGRDAMRNPAGRDGGPIYLPDNLAAPLIAAVASAPPPERPMRRSTLAGALHRSQAALGRAMVVRRALMVNDGAVAREMVVSAAAAAGVEITPEVRPLLERVGLRVLEGVFREEAAREAGIYKSVPEEDPSLAALHLPQKAQTPSAAPGEIAVRALPAVAPEPCQATAVPAEPSPAAPPSTAPAVPLSSLVEPFFDKRKRDKIRQQGMAQKRTTLRLFFEISGDRPARKYRRHDITTFLDTLRRLPSRYGKSPKDKDFSIQELIERADETDAQRLTDKTVKRHLSALSVFFKLAVDRGHLTLTERNDIIGEHDFSLDDAREARDQWTGEELQVIGRETNMGFIDTVTAIPHIQSGVLRALAVTSVGRSPQMPEVPTLAECGLTGYRATNDFGFFAPAGTPPAIVAQLSVATREILVMPEVKSRLDAASIDIYAGTSESFPLYQAEEARRWGDLIRRRNIRME